MRPCSRKPVSSCPSTAGPTPNFEEACKKLTHGEGQDKVYGMSWNLVKDFNGATNFMPQMITQYGMYTD